MAGSGTRPSTSSAATNSTVQLIQQQLINTLNSSQQQQTAASHHPSLPNRAGSFSATVATMHQQQESQQQVGQLNNQSAVQSSTGSGSGQPTDALLMQLLQRYNVQPEQAINLARNFKNQKNLIETLRQLQQQQPQPPSTLSQQQGRSLQEAQVLNAVRQKLLAAQVNQQQQQRNLGNQVECNLLLWFHLIFDGLFHFYSYSSLSLAFHFALFVLLFYAVFLSLFCCCVFRFFLLAAATAETRFVPKPGTPISPAIASATSQSNSTIQQQ